MPFILTRTPVWWAVGSSMRHREPWQRGERLQISAHGTAQTYHFGIARWSTTNYSVNGTIQIGTNEWHYVALVTDGTGKTMQLYLDRDVWDSGPTNNPACRPRRDDPERAGTIAVGRGRILRWLAGRVPDLQPGPVGRGGPLPGRRPIGVCLLRGALWDARFYVTPEKVPAAGNAVPRAGLCEPRVTVF